MQHTLNTDTPPTRVGAQVSAEHIEAEPRRAESATLVRPIVGVPQEATEAQPVPVAAQPRVTAEPSVVRGTPSNPATPSREPEQATAEAMTARGLAAALQQRGGTLTMRLHPESLGAMRIQMELGGGNVAVNLEVHTEQAHRLLTQSLDALRATLESRGLTVQKLGVQLGVAPPPASAATHASTSGGGPGLNDGNGRGQDAGAQFQHDAGDGRSRSWLGGDQRHHSGHGGAGPHAEESPHDGPGTGRDFDDVWRTLRLGVDARA